MKTIFILIFSCTQFSSSRLDAQERAEGQIMSTCIACHGEQGISPNDQWPNIAGQKKTYLLNQLREFKSGVRQNDLMTPIAKMLTDKQMEWLAIYYSEIGKDE